MKEHAEQCVETYFELTAKLMSQLKQAGTPCIDAHQLKKEDCDVVNKLAPFWTQIVFKCSYLESSVRSAKLISLQNARNSVTLASD